jgi:hypothetical protein
MDAWTHRDPLDRSTSDSIVEESEARFDAEALMDAVRPRERGRAVVNAFADEVGCERASSANLTLRHAGWEVTLPNLRAADALGRAALYVQSARCLAGEV